MATNVAVPPTSDLKQEIAEWIEAFDEMIVAEGPQQGAELMTALRQRAREAGVQAENELATPYRNTIPKHDEVPYPGDRDMERRVEALIRWNAMAMVHGRTRRTPASAATFPPTRRWPRCWKWVSTTSSMRPYGDSPAISSTFRVTPRPASMRAPSSKAGLTKQASRISAMNCAADPVFRAIRTPG